MDVTYLQNHVKGIAPPQFFFTYCRALGALIAYFVIGGIYMYVQKGARGLEVIPNYSFWKDLPFLIKVGEKNS